MELKESFAWLASRMLPEPSTDMISEVAAVEASADLEDNACIRHADDGVLRDLVAFLLVCWREVVAFFGTSASFGRTSRAFRHGCGDWSDCVNSWSINVNVAPT